MASYSLQLLSANATGQPVAVAATSTPGTTIHTASGGGIDKVLLYANNIDSSTHNLTLEVAGTGSGYQLTTYTLAAQTGDILVGVIVVPSGKSIYAFADSTNKIYLHGEVWRSA